MIQVLTLLLALVFFMIVTAAVIAVLGIFGVNVNDVVLGRNLQLVSQMLMFLCPALLCLSLFDDQGLSSMRFKGTSLSLMALGIIWLIVGIPFIDQLTRWNDMVHLPQSLSSLEGVLRKSGEMSSHLVQTYLMLPGVDNLWANLLILALAPAICEELFFRGALQRSLSSWLSRPGAAIFLAAAIFSLAHGEVFAFIPRFVLGLLLGYLYHISGSIWVSAAAHFVNNALVVVSYYLFQKGTISVDPQDLTYGIGLVVLSALLLPLMFFVVKKYASAPSRVAS